MATALGLPSPRSETDLTAEVCDDPRMAVRRYAWIAAVSLATALGLLSLVAARHDPAGSFAGTSTLGAIAELGAGWSLVAVGLLFWNRHRGNRFGPLLAAAGFAWFLPELNNPGLGNALGFSIGLVGFVACAPLVGHAALAYPTGRLRSPLEAVAVAVSYAAALLLLGLLPATVFDPRASGCTQCPSNLAFVRGDAALFGSFNRYGLRVGIGWLLALAALLSWRLVRSSHAAASVVFPALVPAAAYLALLAWDFQHSLARGILSNDSFDQRLWRYEAAALVTFALGVARGVFRERQARQSVAHLVVELGRSPRPGAVLAALRQALGDPSLELAYRRPENGGYIDASGTPVTVDPGPDRALTPVLRGDASVASLVHDVRLLDQPGLVQEVLSAARIAVENERLQAEVRAQVEDLRASRTRIVETGDAERRRLERDLHDGAQQSLLALTYDLRLARANAEAEGDLETATLLASAGDETQVAFVELRELAHGIYPAILGEGGLGPALATLVDEAPLPVELGEVPSDRYSAPVETAAYRAVAEAVDDAAGRGASFARVDIRREPSSLLVTVEDDGLERDSQLLHLADRIGALGGSLEVAPTTVRAEIPCA
jgi:signal transduction histidine kinase